MEKFERNGVRFTWFEKDGELYLCTGNPTGELKFIFSGDFGDYYEVVGTTSVVSGKKSRDELYAEWLEVTRFYRECCGIRY